MDFQGYIASRCKTAQPLGGDVDIQCHGDLADDTLLRLEPRGQRDGIAFAPDAHRGHGIAKRNDEPNRAVQLIGGTLNDILRWRRRGSWLGFPERWKCANRPFAEACETGNKFMTKSIHKVAHVIGDAARFERADGDKQPPWSGRLA